MASADWWAAGFASLLAMNVAWLVILAVLERTTLGDAGAGANLRRAMDDYGGIWVVTFAVGATGTVVMAWGRALHLFFWN